MFTKLVILSLAGGALAPAAIGQDPGSQAQPASLPASSTATKPASVRDRILAIQEEYSKVEEEYFKKYNKDMTEAQQQAFFDAAPKVDPYLNRIREIVLANPNDPGSVPGLGWIISMSAQMNESALTDTLKVVEERFLDVPETGRICLSLQYSQFDISHKFLERALATSKNRVVQASACIAMAGYEMGRASSAEFYKESLNDPKMKERILKGVGKEKFDNLLKLDPEEVRKSAVKYYERVASEFADQKALAKQADSALFEFRVLGIGKVAPEIEGADLDGKPMKLSDFRGKVVVLDFWGYW